MLHGRGMLGRFLGHLGGLGGQLKSMAGNGFYDVDAPVQFL